ncbi:phage major capsid protein [Methylobacterium aquaticum]|uniref:Phage capsid-like C-terminal domain-containing protein n=1 Tax=Methylobacterium aquaticum TaxID=270351 RepID=A0A0J6SLM0_9HYPH|nr:phage major capsid protein [Methylobacterium aquaticum]KMO34318.1 hypothetical protein VP06_14730 [Methylobacterium aquaticum]
MTLAQLREKLKADRMKLAALRGKAAADGATAEDRAAYKAGIATCNQVLDLIKDAEEEERIEGLSSKGANDPIEGIGHNGGPDVRTWAVPKQTVAKEQKTLLAVAADAKAALINKYGDPKERATAISVLKAEGFGDFADEQIAIQRRKTVTSGISSNVLLPQPVTSEVIELLRPQATFLEGNPRRVRLIGGKFRQPRGASPATAAYVGEGAKKPVGTPGFDDINMSSYKLAGIVLLTNEALKWPVVDIEAYVRNDLRQVLGLTMDSAMYFGNGTGATPLGIFKKSGITTLDASTTGYFANVKAPTVAEIDSIASRMILSMTGANIVMTNKWRWIFSYRTWHYLSNLRDGNGNRIYPELAQGNFKGISFLVSNQIPENGGTTTDESSLSLVDFGHVLFAEEEGMIMKSSTEATIDDNGTTVFLWQQNMMAILAEMEHDVTLDQSKAVATLTKVRWGAP